MRLVLAAALAVAVLCARGGEAFAADAQAEAPRTRIVIQRCNELPMSLSLTIAENLAARGLSPRSLVSSDEPVFATPSDHVPTVTPPPVVPRPFSPVPRACESPDDLGCQVSAPVPPPIHVQLKYMIVGVTLADAFGGVPEASLIETMPRVSAWGAPREGFRRSIERPPTA